MNNSESKSRKFALQLANDILEKGYFEAAGAGASPATTQISANENNFYNFDEFWGGFAGLSVQGVGCASIENQEQVYIYVNKGDKRKLDAISDNKDEDGISIKVIKIGKTIIKPETAINANRRGNVFIRNNRIACGSSCQPAGESYTGTFGAIIQKGEDLFALSNNHVFAACNHTPIGQPIMSPSNADTGPNALAPRLIARHSEILELRSGDPRLVPLTSMDAAAAKIVPDEVTSWQGSVDEGYDTPNKYITPSPGMNVKKVGRTTGLTLGIVEAEVPGQWYLEYKSKKFTATVWFQEIWTVKASGITPFALPGDSGSLIVTEDGKNAVGLLFAAEPKGDYGYIFPIEKVLQRFNMTLVSGHGI